MADLLERLRASLGSRYRIQRELGRGAMATVYLAEDLKHHRPVALKVLNPELAGALGPERFLREIETASRLTHPHILPLHDSGNADGLLYYVMPYVEGESLRARLAREKQLPLEEALQITREVAEALNYAHQHGVVHRDIKPENILLESGQAVVADFGIARAIDRAGGGTWTGTAVAMGTPAYMSPEQAAGSRDLDGRSDQYSLGCVLYEMLAGQPPFTGPAVESLVYQHLSATPRPVTELRPAVGPAVRDALAKALAKIPADRFTSTAEFMAALAQAKEVVAPAPPAERGETSTEADAHTRRAPRVPRIALAVSLVALAVVAVWLSWGPLSHRLRDGNAPRPAKKDWILVAEFEGPPDDSTLGTAARSLVSAALDQSAILATVSSDQIQLALEQAGKPAKTRVSAEVARELAYRSTVRTVLDGLVSRLGSRYTVTLRVTDVEEDRQLFAITDVARSEDDLIRVLTRMGGRVRERLGESPETIRTTRGSEWSVATPSFEAYRRWAEGLRIYSEGDYAGALKLLREALALDPAFGVAWASLGHAYVMLGKPDSALMAVEEASRHPGSLTPAYRLYNEGRVAWWRGDARSALEIFDRVTRLYPQSVEAGFVFNNEALIFEGQGRLEEALESNNQFDAGGLAPNILSHAVRVRLLIALGRLAEARAAAQPLRGAWRRAAELGMALAGGDWKQADSLATAYEDAPQPGVGTLVQSLAAHAQAAAVRGEVTVAEMHLRRAETLQHEKGNPALAPRAPRDRVLLALVSGRPVPRPESWLERDTTTSALITRAYMAAASGETVLAQQLLARLRARSTTRLGAHGSTPEFIEAWVAAKAGRWGDVVRLVAQPAREGTDHGGPGADPIRDRIGPASERWLVAQAYERLGQPDSAAAFYLQMLGPDSPGVSLIGLVSSFVHQRLVLLYARMGRLEQAERHLAILERDLTRPDPDVRQLLDEARSAARSARGMARPERVGAWEAVRGRAPFATEVDGGPAAPSAPATGIARRPTTS